ncbi:MAG: YbaK/EbsC family protein [Clostridiales bacterium]|jgi:prolyl-tRNA editing enzyme YbaK/EbsC (Cys-tRNA(Pro) deacylase)|nr:YbaK/EbsC family protein [Clostridiales bacterium]
MSIQRVREYFGQFNMEDKIMEFDVSSATVELAAKALDCEPARIGKTLSFMANGKCILVLTAGDAKIDNAKYKAKFGAKAKMLSPDEALELVGHAVGGVCPFGINEGVDVYLDISLKRFATVFPACGSANSAIELTIPQLERYSQYKEWVDVCKEWDKAV